MAQTIGGACATAGALALVGSSNPGELLYCSGTTWGLAEAVTSAGFVGIGATAPKSPLDVNGGITVGSYAGVNAAPSNSIIVSGTVAIDTTVEVRHST